MESRVELKLLACLEALVQEGSVTRAAEKLGMSQPGMSNALARLRKLTHDPLLVRTQDGIQLTERARVLGGLAKTGLHVLEEIFADPRPFEPREARGTIVVAMADAMAQLLGPPLMAVLEEEAPELTLNLQRVDQAHLLPMLEDGKCDLAVGHLVKVPDSMYARTLLSQDIAVIRARDHPVIRSRLTLSQYCRARHITASAPDLAVTWAESAVADTLKAMGRERAVGARVNSILLAPPIVARSSLLCTLPAWLARQYSATLPVSVHPLPFATPVFKHSLIWHARTHRGGRHQWLREKVIQTVDQCGLKVHLVNGERFLR